MGLASGRLAAPPRLPPTTGKTPRGKKGRAEQQRHAKPSSPRAVTLRGLYCSKGGRRVKIQVRTPRIGCPVVAAKGNAGRRGWGPRFFTSATYYCRVTCMLSSTENVGQPDLVVSAGAAVTLKCWPSSISAV